MLKDNERKMQDMQLTWQERLEQARYDVHIEYLMTSIYKFMVAEDLDKLIV